MKKGFIGIIVLTFALSVSTPVFAGDLPKPISKIFNGAKDVITSPLLLIEHPKKEMEASDNKVVGLFKGILQAPFHFVKKLGYGIIDIVTFPVE